ncbi:MAG: 6-phosphofructokinase, partial [Actinomycetota bacterium]
RNHALLVVAEGCKTEKGEKVTTLHRGGSATYGGIGQYLGDCLAEMVDAETRVTVLGHVQRGGMPCMRDRLIASAFGVHAVDLIAQGKMDRMVAWQHGQVADVPLSEVAGITRAVDPYGTLALTARGLGIYIGEGG